MNGFKPNASNSLFRAYPRFKASVTVTPPDNATVDEFLTAAAVSYILNDGLREKLEALPDGRTEESGRKIPKVKILIQPEQTQGEQPDGTWKVYIDPMFNTSLATSITIPRLEGASQALTLDTIGTKFRHIVEHFKPQLKAVYETVQTIIPKLQSLEEQDTALLKKMFFSIQQFKTLADTKQLHHVGGVRYTVLNNTQEVDLRSSEDNGPLYTVTLGRTHPSTNQPTGLPFITIKVYPEGCKNKNFDSVYLAYRVIPSTQPTTIEQMIYKNASGQKDLQEFTVGEQPKLVRELVDMMVMLFQQLHDNAFMNIEIIESSTK